MPAASARARARSRPAARHLNAPAAGRGHRGCCLCPSRPAAARCPACRAPWPCRWQGPGHCSRVMAGPTLASCVPAAMRQLTSGAPGGIARRNGTRHATSRPPSAPGRAGAPAPHSGAAGQEVLHHLPGHVAGVGRHAPRRQAVVGRAHQHLRRMQRRRLTARIRPRRSISASSRPRAPGLGLVVDQELQARSALRRSGAITGRFNIQLLLKQWLSALDKQALQANFT